jgi:hypothetical protein
LVNKVHQGHLWRDKTDKIDAKVIKGLTSLLLDNPNGTLAFQDKKRSKKT